MASANECQGVNRYTVAVFCIDAKKEAKRGKYEFLVHSSFGPADPKWTCKEFFNHICSQTQSKQMLSKECLIVPNHDGTNDSGVQIDDAEVRSIYYQCMNGTRPSMTRNDVAVDKIAKIRSYLAGNKTVGFNQINAWDFLVIFHDNLHTKSTN